ncbi:MAG: response regulator [Leptospiraceae bacterium]|nr:response regulator [Leptospiraceae bacterium]NUM42737.1 response regulator [Leptospiraceae bacterium]
MKPVILCVDDEEIILMSISEELKYHFDDKFEIETAMSAKEALILIEELKKEGTELPLVITDFLMPDIRGDELISKIRDNYPEIKSVMITGYIDKETKENISKKEGVIAIFTKPWDFKDLFKLIQTNFN